MLHHRVITVDTSHGGSAHASVTVGPCEYAGCYYRFSDPSQSADIELINRVEVLLNQAGASNADGIKRTPDNVTKPPVSGLVEADVSAISAGNPGDHLDITLLLDFGGAG